ncbi:MAG TPA: hypothetical protein PLQ97_15095 [Myxococcota bacterium]|nr:hypothetical protein [Myxococcota bacterium]HQK52549.1 hypothetical protein [Myxococcota bacterium]
MRAQTCLTLLLVPSALACYDTGPLMRPGENCMGCHTGGRAPRWEVAGTVFECAQADRHEGVAGVDVVFRDANGTEVLRLTTNEAGNFYSKTDLPEGYRVSLVRGETVREMPFTPTKGACNSCHTMPPENGAPGRLYIGTIPCSAPAPSDS